jgi:hypothetical protein
MSESSKGVRETLEGLLYYQARTEALLGHLLGRTYTLGDAAFYLGGASVALASGLLPRTRPARYGCSFLPLPCHFFFNFFFCAWCFWVPLLPPLVFPPSRLRRSLPRFVHVERESE